MTTCGAVTGPMGARIFQSRCRRVGGRPRRRLIERRRAGGTKRRAKLNRDIHDILISDFGMTRTRAPWLLLAALLAAQLALAIGAGERAPVTDEIYYIAKA